jgi:hypothetical protein
MFVSACTTLEPVEMPATEVQRMILSGEIPLAGESIKVVTVDGKSYQYRVTEVDTEKRLIRGKEKYVPIDDVVAIETREFSLGKTALLAGGSYVFLALLAIAVGPVLLL